jgi:hypothetical protein
MSNHRQNLWHQGDIILESLFFLGTAAHLQSLYERIRTTTSQTVSPHNRPRVLTPLFLPSHTSSRHDPREADQEPRSQRDSHITYRERRPSTSPRERERNHCRTPSQGRIHVHKERERKKGGKQRTEGAGQRREGIESQLRVTTETRAVGGTPIIAAGGNPHNRGRESSHSRGRESSRGSSHDHPRKRSRNRRQ